MTAHLTANKNSINFPIITIGGEDIETTCNAIFTAIPTDSGMAFIIFQSGLVALDQTPNHFGSFPLIKVVENLIIEPNHIYLLPPDKPMFVKNARFYQPAPTLIIEAHSLFDAFLQALAVELTEKTICLILSGSGTMGRVGVKSIHEMGGLVIVQDPTSATQPEMPQEIVNTGLVDLVLPTAEIGEQLWHFMKKCWPIQPQSSPLSPEIITNLHQIFKRLRTQTRHDFSMYKETTVLRRVERRMVALQINQLPDYVDYLAENSSEAELLLKELLIGVTSFFRHPKTFEALHKLVLQKLIRSRSENQPLRVWVPACSTGEEAYSIAILLTEELANIDHAVRIQIFATDIDRAAIEKARAGIYSKDIAYDVSAERLSRFFHQHSQDYRVNKNIRDMVVFASQNVIHEPPFSRLDLVSCRNFLIYLKPELQQKILALFHYALVEDGYLFLGPSETLRELAHYFRPLHRPYNIFQCLTVSSNLQTLLNFPTSLSIAPRRNEIPVSTSKVTKIEHVETAINHRQFLETLLLNQYTPSAVIVNEKYNIIYIHGRIGKYLDPSTGEATWNIMHLATTGLKIPLLTGLREVFSKQQKIVYENVPLENNGLTETINLIFHPMTEPTYLQGLVVVIFAESLLAETISNPQKASVFAEADYNQVLKLEKELSAIHERLQTTVEELETSNEELQVLNESLQASNEELQTSNEELNTTKEELQSNNEELQVTNAELKSKGEELIITNTDLENLLLNVDLGVIFLDKFGFIRRSNRTIARILKLTDLIVGQSFFKIINEPYQPLGRAVQGVLRNERHQNLEFLAPNGIYYLVQIYPLRTIHNTHDGAVISLTDITEQKQTVLELAQHRDHLEELVSARTADLADMNQRLMVQISEREKIEAVLRHSREQLLYDNLHDPLTRLPNRKMFMQAIEQAIQSGTTCLFAVMFLDLNRFKAINDSFGHQAGDELLLNVAQRLEESLLIPGAMVARLAGDEFAILLKEIATPNLAWQQAQHITEAFTQPFTISGHKVFTTMSIGITLSSTPFENSEDLLHQADRAMFTAKYKHQDWIELFNPQESHYKVIERLHLENDLWEAIKLNQLELHYQPIVDLNQNKWVAMEALIRWQHPRLGLLYPQNFLDLAENTGLMIPVDQWMFRMACHQLKQWHILGYKIELAINLSISSLQHKVMADFIQKTLTELEFPADDLILEITERAILNDLILAQPTLKQLQNGGVKLSLDDFGTGYSSLKHLELLNLNFVKLDQSFVAQIGQNPKSELIITSLIDLAQQFNLPTIAEGVETEPQLAFLRANKCGYAQGFLFGKAMPAPQMSSRLVEMVAI